MRILLLIVFGLGISFMAISQTKTIYTCPMHPEVQSAKPGNCPKCGMKLEKKTIRVKAAPKKTQPKTQPPKTTEKPVITPREPVTEKKDTVEKEVKAPAADVYTCPMHPEVVSDKPGRCPKCGMALVKKPAKEEKPEGSDDEEKPLDISSMSRVNLQPGRTVVYHLYVKDSMVNFTGKKRKAIAINGSIPAPTLEFQEGDTAEIHLHNGLDEETSLHWHGIILPNRFDGVPLLTTKRIKPGESFVYRFRIVQNGTYWYHSHSALQEQSGMYGALILKKREADMSGHDMSHAAMAPRKNLPVVLSEWTDDNPMQVQRRLRTANDWFSIKKGSTQSYSEAIREGHFGTKFVNEWKRMKAMDVSDVYYPRFLVNGLPANNATEFKAGDRVRLQVVNAGASSYFWLGWAGGRMTVVANDGNEVEPVEVDRLIVAVAETYDVEVTIPSAGSYEFRATAEDRTGYSSLWLGNGEKKYAPTLPRLKYFEGMKMMNDMMNTDGTMDDMGMNMSLQKMDMNTVMYPEIDSAEILTLNYDMLRSTHPTPLEDERTRTLHFTLTGNMNRYLWTLDNKTVTETDRIFINRGENLRLVLTNNSMMRHPMHLHGHDFRVLNSKGEYSPLKNVIDIMPMETDTIEFAANQDGNWFFHCHILYHMMAGMGRVFTYHNSSINPDLPDAEEAFRQFKKHPDQNMKHLMARIGLESNGSMGEAMLSSDRYALVTEWRVGIIKHHGLESETMFGRYLGANQWWFPYIGYDYHYNPVENESEKNMFGQLSNQNNRSTFTVGIQYTTPWLMLADARIDGKGKFRFELSREDIPLTPRLRLGLMGNTDREYMFSLRHIVTKWLALSANYDSEMSWGAGVTVTY